MTKCNINDLVLYEYSDSVAIGRVLWKDGGAVLINYNWLPRVVSADDVLACDEKNKLVVLRDAVQNELDKHHAELNKAREAYQQMLLNSDPNIVRKIFKKIRK